MLGLPESFSSKTAVIRGVEKHFLLTLGLLPFLLSAQNFETSEFFRTKNVKVEPFGLEGSFESAERERLTVFAQKLNRLYSNVMKSYQQEYGFKFVSHSTKKADFRVAGSILTKEIARAKYSKGELKHLLKWEDDYYLTIGHHAQESATPFSLMLQPLAEIEGLDQVELIGYLNKNSALTGMKNYGKQRDRTLTPKNDVLKYERTLSIERVFECENCPDDGFAKEVTDLTASYLIHFQGEKTGYTYLNYNLYFPYAKKSKVDYRPEVELVGKISYDTLNQIYDIRLYFFKDGKDVTIGGAYGQNRPFSFHRDDRYDYYRSVIKLENKIFRHIYSYFFYRPEEDVLPLPSEYLKPIKGNKE